MKQELDLENLLYEGAAKQQERMPIAKNIAFTTLQLSNTKKCVVVEGNYGNSLKVTFKDGSIKWMPLEDSCEYTIGEEIPPEDVRYNIYENTYKCANTKYTLKVV